MNKDSNCNKIEIINESKFDKRYKILNNCGNGHSSIAYKVLDTVTGEERIAKIVDDQLISEFRIEEIILKIIDKYNINSIIKFYDSGTEPLTIDGETKRRNYLILEYGDHGTLYDNLDKTSDGFSEDVSKYIFYEILKTVKALHGKGICHRDIKPENFLLVGDNYEIKLCDFGFAYPFLDKNQNKKKLIKSVGTPYYCAPEILENKFYDPEKVDYFSIGALLFLLLTKKFAFEEAKTYEPVQRESQNLYDLIIRKKIDDYWEIFEIIYGIKKLSPEFKELFIKMVAYNPSERPSFEEIMNSKWMKEIKEADENKLNELREKMITEIKKAHKKEEQA